MIFTLIFLGQMSQAQNGKLKKVAQEYEDYSYLEAIKGYNQLVADGFSQTEIYKNLGNSNYRNAKYEEASQWYGKLFETTENDIEPDYYYRYAQTLKSLQQYQASDEWMEKFMEQSQVDGRAVKFDDKRDYLERIKRNSGRFKVAPVSFNSKYSDFAPSFWGDSIVFASARDTGVAVRNIHKWNGNSFLDLYVADGEGKVSDMARKLNTSAHESSTVFTKDGNTVFFTRNNYNKGFERDEKGISRLKVLKASKDNNKWTAIQELPFNSNGHSVAHPTLSNDEKTLYFSSDMPGTIGDSDIFKVTINEDGTFGIPENLGTNVNTEGRESFPFISEDNILYFSSDGHPGLGGLDVFALDLGENATGEVINVGEPLNGKSDDFSFIINGEGKGYFASDREGGLGYDDIYTLVQEKPLNFECFFNLNGIVTDKGTQSPLSGAKVVVTSSEGTVAEVEADANGAFAVALDCNQGPFTITANQEDYLGDTIEFAIEKTASDQTVQLALEKETPEQMLAAAGINKEETDSIDEEEMYGAIINFDFDKSNIRSDAQEILNDLVGYLEAHPEARIAIESHTDSSGSSSYNQKLSERRAQETYNYLLAKGISAERMTQSGYGETQLLDCEVWENCSRSKNESNRRSEIRILK
ncbi:MAG: OmpA family protein [Bacteroidota bacterium]